MVVFKDILHNYGEALAAGSIALLDKEEMTGEELAILIKKNPPLMPDEEVISISICTPACHSNSLCRNKISTALVCEMWH